MPIKNCDATSMADYRASAVHGQNIIICGIPPRNRLVTLDQHPCWNCKGANVLRVFSGSGWYEDSRTCLDCGEDVTSGYRSFRRAWREKNIANAQRWMDQVIPWGTYTALTKEIVREEMGWTDD